MLAACSFLWFPLFPFLCLSFCRHGAATTISSFSTALLQRSTLGLQRAIVTAFSSDPSSGSLNTHSLDLFLFPLRFLLGRRPSPPGCLPMPSPSILFHHLLLSSPLCVAHPSNTSLLSPRPSTLPLLCIVFHLSALSPAL